VLVVLLIMAISISPRIRAGSLKTGRNVDLRYEDILLMVILFSWFINLSIRKYKEIYISPLFKPILIYLLCVVFSTCFGIIMGWILPSMAFFFFLKEIEYFLIFFIVANFIVNTGELIVAIYSVMLCGLANGAYILYQVISGHFAGGSYGAGSLGEPGTFPTSGYLTMVFMLSIAIFSMVKVKGIKVVSGSAALLCGIGLLATGSRANTIGALFSISILIFLIALDSFKNGNVRAFYTAIAVLIMLFIFYNTYEYTAHKRPVLKRLTNMAGIKKSFIETRVKYIYALAINQFKRNPVFGLGKTASTTVIGGTGAAHNYYLRILTELGVIGLIAFLYMLYRILVMCLYLIRYSILPICKGAGIGCLLAALSLMVAATAQDAFTPVKVNETFWFTVGAAASAYSLELEKFAKKPSTGNVKILKEFQIEH
jgi:O-antigen ligase